MGDTKKIGKCNSCNKDIYIGGRSGLYLGHDKLCKNHGTAKLD